MNDYRPGQARPRCARCPGEIRPRDGNDFPIWEHVEPPADGHAAVRAVILTYVKPERGHKEATSEAIYEHDVRRPRDPDRSPGTTPKVRPEDWEYS